MPDPPHVPPTIRHLRQRSTAGDLIRRGTYEGKTLVAPHPSLALPVARLRGHGVVVSSRTEVVIEGYPRSANNFAVAAFRLAQGREVEVAHHTHAPAQVLAALRRGVPVMVLVREPEEACLEFLLLRPSLTPRQALRGWIRFYRPLVPYRHRVVVGAFPQVTSDFGAVIRRLNERFGTDFVPFEATPENVARVFGFMDAYWRDRIAEGPVLERVVGRPSEERERMKDELRPWFGAGQLEAVRTQAHDLYRVFAEEP